MTSQHITKRLMIAAILLVTAILPARSQQQSADSLHTLIVFFDGLRPDYITAGGMPHLYQFKQRAAIGKQHHSVFPTVTRVNATSYATGAYPGTHGLLGNSVFFPEVSKNSSLNTGNAEELNNISKALNGQLLTAISLGEILKKAGKEMMVFSSGTTGQAMMQNHTVSGAIINPAMILPESMKPDIIEKVGPIPPAAKPNIARHQWITNALMHYGLKSDGPLVSAIWFSDPDGSAHSDGIGSPAAVAAIKSVDEQFGRIVKYLEEQGLANKFNIIISTDHGFVTHVGKESLGNLLISQGLKKDKDSDDVVLAGGAIYVKNHDKIKIQQIVNLLHAQDWVGALFTKAAKKGGLKGSVKGTLSFESIHWNHERSADILADMNWDDRINSAGYAGASYSGGVAGHGTLSPYEVHIELLAAGPGFKPSLQSELPTSNVDIVPTLLHLHGLAQPASMDGRIMQELLVNPGNPAKVVAKNDQITTTATYQGGTYQLVMDRTLLGSYQYINFTKVTRLPDTGKQ